MEDLSIASRMIEAAKTGSIEAVKEQLHGTLPECIKALQDLIIYLLIKQETNHGG